MVMREEEKLKLAKLIHCVPFPSSLLGIEDPAANIFLQVALRSWGLEGKLGASPALPTWDPPAPGAGSRPVPWRFNFHGSAELTGACCAQAYTSQLKLFGLALALDMVYVTHSVGRLMHCLFKICLAAFCCTPHTQSVCSLRRRTSVS